MYGIKIAPALVDVGLYSPIKYVPVHFQAVLCECGGGVVLEVDRCIVINTQWVSDE